MPRRSASSRASGAALGCAPCRGRGEGTSRGARLRSRACRALGCGRRPRAPSPPGAGARDLRRAPRRSRARRTSPRRPRASVAEPARLLPPGDALLLRGAVTACFDPERLAALALDSLLARLDTATRPQRSAGSSARRRRALLTRATAEPRSRAARADGARAAAPEPPRDALLLRFERDSAVTRARGAATAALVFAALLRAANPLLPPLQRYSAGRARRAARAARDRFRPARPSDRSELRRRYAGIPSAELELGARLPRQPGRGLAAARARPRARARAGRAPRARPRRIWSARSATARRPGPLQVARAQGP